MPGSLDIIAIGESLIELSSDKSLAFAQSLDKYYGGDILCSAITALKLGSKVGYISRVGNDYFKDYLLESWVQEGLDISQVKLAEGFNGLYFVARVPEGQKEFSYYRKKTSATFLSIDDISANYIKKAFIVYSSGITQSLSLSAKEAVKKAFEIAKDNGLKTAYSMSFSPKMWDAEEAKEAFEEIESNIDILFLNLASDVKTVLEISSIDMLMKNFWDKEIDTIVVKSVQDGGYFVGYCGEVSFVEFWTKNVVDTTGSGDCFIGAFLHGIVQGMNAFESARLGSIVAGLQAQGIGAIKSIPSKDLAYKHFRSEEKTGA